MTQKNRFHEKNMEELQMEYESLSRDLFRIRSESRIARQVERPHRLRALRKDRARILTALRAKQLGS